MTTFSMRSSGLILPGKSKTRSIHFGEWEIIGEDGIVCWVNKHTGQSFSRTPEASMEIAKDLAEGLLGPAPSQSSIACNLEEYYQWERALQAIVEISKEQQVVQAENLERAKSKKVF